MLSKLLVIWIDLKKSELKNMKSKILCVICLFLALTIAKSEMGLKFDYKNHEDAKKRWLMLVKYEEKCLQRDRVRDSGMYADPKRRTRDAVFLDINGDGILEVTDCRPWDFDNDSGYYGSFHYQGGYVKSYIPVQHYHGWNYSESEGDIPVVKFNIDQLYGIAKNGKITYYIFDNDYRYRISRVMDIEDDLQESRDNYDGYSKGYKGSKGWLEPSREELVKEYGEETVRLREVLQKECPDGQITEEMKENLKHEYKKDVTSEYLLKNWERHTVTELYMNEEKTKVLARRVKSAEEFKKLLEGAKWEQANVCTEVYQWAYAKTIEAAAGYYDEERKDPMMMDVGVENEVIKVAEYSHKGKDIIFTKDGAIPKDEFIAQKKKERQAAEVGKDK